MFCDLFMTAALATAGDNGKSIVVCQVGLGGTETGGREGDAILSALPPKRWGFLMFAGAR